MIVSRTVFILGAGASCPYRFPLGNGLKKRVIEMDSNDRRRLFDCGITERDLSDFISAFRQSGHSSIDSFLAGRKTLTRVGKLAIALELTKHEIIENLFNAEKDDWYHLLFDKLLTPTLEQFGQNQVSFVTFNYDRSLEAFLFTALKNSFDYASDEQVAKALSNIPMIHLHGHLGRLPWQPHKDDEPERAYDKAYDSSQLLSAAAGITIIHEADGETSQFAFARQQFQNASQIFFLGFSYHPDNMKRLRIGETVSESCHIAGSFYDFTDAEIAQRRILSPTRLMDPGAAGHMSREFLKHNTRYQLISD